MEHSEEDVSAATLQVLREVFGYPAFRGRQAEIVNHVTAGGDALVLMPTGGGKSLCYQVPAIVRYRTGRGLTLVISPLIALMHDQVGALLEAGVNAAYLNSSLTTEQATEVERQMFSGELVLLYVAPERLTTARFMAQLQALHDDGWLALFAIDEAHCVSQWGHDFRPDYRSVSTLHDRFPSVPRIALTATADALTRDDMLHHLCLEQAQHFVSSFDRPNIRYTIVEKKDTLQQLLRFIKTEHSTAAGHEAGVVYCQSRRKVEDVAAQLAAAGLNTLPYHAGLDQATRQRHQDRFLREEGLIIVATIAFGMGIDKPDVRFVAHVDMPKNIEGYYQETGRGGRDGEFAQAWMAYGLQDVLNQLRMIDDSSATDEFKQVLRGKLDALLAMAEATDCRRVRLLAYFGEASQPCGNCDNCLHPPATWNASDAARKFLSCVYRVQQASDMGFGVGHLLDILRGKRTEKVLSHGHERLSTFGIGTEVSEADWRCVVRQLVAREAIWVDGAHFNTVHLLPTAKAILKGEVELFLRVRDESRPRKRQITRQHLTSSEASLNLVGRETLSALRAWRSQVSREHNLPAFIIFHDATLCAIAAARPQQLSELEGISGLGQKKLQAYGAEVLRIVRSVAS